MQRGEMSDIRRHQSGSPGIGEVLYNQQICKVPRKGASEHI